MSYVFGDTFICDDAATAKLVTFSAEVGGAKSVTFDGDVYDPSGTLSGGSTPSSSGILIKVQELMDMERKLREAQGKLSALEQEEAKSRRTRRPGPLSSSSISMPCARATAATSVRPRPFPGDVRLRSPR